MEKIKILEGTILWQGHRILPNPFDQWYDAGFIKSGDSLRPLPASLIYKEAQ